MNDHKQMVQILTTLQYLEDSEAVEQVANYSDNSFCSQIVYFSLFAGLAPELYNLNSCSPERFYHSIFKVLIFVCFRLHVPIK